jgi:hypothetical protein
MEPGKLIEYHFNPLERETTINFGGLEVHIEEGTSYLAVCISPDGGIVYLRKGGHGYYENAINLDQLSELQEKLGSPDQGVDRLRRRIMALGQQDRE